MSTPRFHRLAVNDLRRETADAVSLSFVIPKELAEDYRFSPGQYLTLRTTMDGEEVRRSYSICSGPDDGELRIAVEKIASWLNNGIKPSEIAVLYRANVGGWVRELASLISQRAAVYWPQHNSGDFGDRSGVCLTTMHSAKGLQWRAVLVMRTDMMPVIPDRDGDRVEQERLERGLMYVAMTRAEEMLAFTRSTLNGFASRIQQLLDHSVDGAR